MYTAAGLPPREAPAEIETASASLATGTIIKDGSSRSTGTISLNLVSGRYETKLMPASFNPPTILFASCASIFTKLSVYKDTAARVKWQLEHGKIQQRNSRARLSRPTAATVEIFFQSPVDAFRRRRHLFDLYPRRIIDGI